jgi:hypothetical protein
MGLEDKPQATGLGRNATPTRNRMAPVKGDK